MITQTAYRAPAKPGLARPECPRCGSIVLMAERAAFNPDGRIRHTWSCDDCGHEFVTLIGMRAQQPRHNIAS